jgi:hypothetical protein
MGKLQAVNDADAIWSKMKESMKDGQITEQLQVFTHSRGTAFGNGYMQKLRSELIKRAEKEGIGFAYDKNSIVEYSINIAPHQSNSIVFPESGTKNVTISHVGDPASGNDSQGDVTNVHSIPDKEMWPGEQHNLPSFNRELNFVLNILENTPKGEVTSKLKEWYGKYDKNRSNGGSSSVTKGN